MKRRRLTSTRVADQAEFDAEEEPSWLPDAAQVFSVPSVAQNIGAPEAENARAALVAAGIPCYLQVADISQEEDPAPITSPAYAWRLMVPGSMNLHATSVLDRDIFNEEFESDWKNHLAVISDEELHSMNPQEVFCGLFDRIERVTRAYDEELARRGMESPQ